MICSIFRGCHPTPEEILLTKKTWKWVVAVAVLAALVSVAWLWLRNRGFDWAVFWATTAGLSWPWLSAALVLVMVSYLGRALRWAVLMRPVKPHPSLGGLFSSTLIGFTAITLLGRPGEFVRPYLISVRQRVPLSSQLAALLLERIYDLLAALVVFGFALSRVRHSEVHAGPALSWVLAVGGWAATAVGAASLVVLVLIRQYAEKMRLRLLDALRFVPARHHARVERLVTAFVQGVESTRSSVAVVQLIAYTVLEWVIIAGCLYAIVRAYGHLLLAFGVVDVMILLGFIAFGAVIQIPGIGGGVQVVSVLVLTELFHVPLEAATSVAMVSWFITFVAVVPVGVLLGLREGLNWSKLKSLEQEVVP